MRSHGSLLILLALGCSHQPQVERDAVSFNLAAERVQNEQLLLNILRAAQRKPMQFTALTLVRGNMTGTVAAGGDYPFGGDALSTFIAKPSLSYSNNASFDLAILDSKEFMSGILSPVDIKLVRHYWDQDWPKDMLLYLFIKKVELIHRTTSDAVLHTYNNYPSDHAQYAAFKRLVDILAGAKGPRIGFVSKKSEDPYGPPMTAEAAGNLQQLVVAQQAGLVLKPDGDKYRLYTTSTAVGFAALNVIPDLEAPDGKKYSIGSTITGDMEVQALQGAVPADGKFLLKFYLRSPEGMLYYLGEIVRALRDGARAQKPDGTWSQVPFEDAMVLTDGEPRPLFVAREADFGEAGVLSVTYDGVRYLVPHASGHTRGLGRSMHCLQLLTQVYALYKSSKDLPTTAATVLIGAER